MHRSLHRLGVLAAVVAASGAIAVTAAGAADAIGVTGSVAPTSQALGTRTAGGNVLVDGTGTHAWTGSLSGTSTLETHFVLHPSGLVTYQGAITFTGDTPCGYGTIVLNASGSGPFPGPMAGHAATVDAGTATLAMHASLDTTLFLTPSGAFVTYTGEVLCG